MSPPGMSPPVKRSAFALPKSVDRGFVKMMATKRTFTGAFSLIGIVVITGIVVRSEHLHEPRTMGSLALAWLLLGAGGAWSLYDGIRLWKLLAKS